MTAPGPTGPVARDQDHAEDQQVHGDDTGHQDATPRDGGPDGVTPDGVTPDGVTPDGVTPDGVTPGGGAPGDGTAPADGGRPPVAEADLDAVRAQLGRVPRGVVEVAHRCGCGKPDVVRTSPRLPDGTPFPTSYYLTCPRAASLVGTLESGGVMREMSERLEQDEDLAAGHRRAHEDYLARREELGHVEEIAGISAGGMPTRVKCLHVLLAHSLAAGPGTTPLGDEVREALGDWWRTGSCAAADAAAPSTP